MPSHTDHHLLLHPPQSDSDCDSDNGQPGFEPRRHADLSDSIFRSYFEFTGRSQTTPADLSKIQSFLNSSSSGALSCLICLERIRPSDPTWSCTSLCFAVISSVSRAGHVRLPIWPPYAPPRASPLHRIGPSRFRSGIAPNAGLNTPNLKSLRLTFVFVENWRTLLVMIHGFCPIRVVRSVIEL